MDSLIRRWSAIVAATALVVAGLVAPAAAAELSQEDREGWSIQERARYGAQLADADESQPSEEAWSPAIEADLVPFEDRSGTPGTTEWADAHPATEVAGRWPAPGEARVSTDDADVDGFPVSVSASENDGDGAVDDTPRHVRARVLGQDRARAAGLEGFMASLAVEEGTSGPVQVSLDLSDVLVGASADWASRLQLVTMPACVVTTPQEPECQVATPVGGASLDDGVLTGVVDLPGSAVGRGAGDAAADASLTTGVEPTGTPLIVGVAASVSGEAGSWGSTPLAASASWRVSEQTGSFGWSYPMRVPPSPGGLEPELALAYDSGSLDGRTAATNNQTSVIGDGWDLSTGGFIERKYIPCNDNKDGGNNAALSVGDLCWDSDNATLVLGGRATELVKSGADTYVPVDDDGTRVQRLRLPSGWGNGDNDSEYWQVTTPDGTVYTFGRSKRAVDDVEQYSTWTVRVYGNHPGDPCYNASFASAGCNQAWRWNVDHVQDTLGNSMSLFYAREWNSYGYNNGQGVASYVAGGALSRIDYGTRAGAEKGVNAPARVSFGLAERCVGAAADCEPADLTAATKANWPDVPFDLICASGATSCPGNPSPSFFTRKRVTKVTTQIATDITAGTYKAVDTWTLTHTFPDPGDGDLSQAVLWLDSITHQGNNGTAITLPKTQFGGTQLPNRVDSLSDGRSPMTRYRLTSIRSESGGSTAITYSAHDCVNDGATVSLPASPQSNTRRCFPVWWTPVGSSGPVMEYFHKYAVKQVTQAPQDGMSLPVQTDYEYANPAWAYTDDDLTPAKHRTWSAWRGFRTVTVRGGYDTLGAARTKATTTYFQGMDADRSDPADPGAKRSVSLDGITDHKQFAGQPRTQAIYSDNSTSVVSTTTSWPWRSVATATDIADPTLQAFHTGVQRQDVATPLAAGGTRTTSAVTTFDSYGMPVTVDDRGDTSITSDDRCTRAEYARNEGANILIAVSRVETVAVACDTSPTRPAHVVSDVRTAYDGGAVGAAPTKGLVTQSQELSAYSGTTPTYVTTATTAYDVFGRVTSVTDALGRRSTTAYTQANGLTTAMASTSPDPDGAGALTALTTTSTLDPAWGLELKSTDANGNVTSGQYDALGRLNAVWEPGRVQGTDTASSTFAYAVSSTGINAVVTKTLNTAGTGYITSSQILDGLLRVRQTQATSLDAANPGRVITDTIYDSRGLATVVNTGWLATGTPAATLLVTPASVPATTTTAYDGAGRTTKETFSSIGVEKWSTATTYGGDRVTVDPPTGAVPTTTVSDARGNTTSLTQFLGASPTGASQTTTYTYDLAGRLARMKDAAGNAWSYTYDLRGRQVAANDPDKGTTTTTYDAAGQVTTTTDARGLVLAYTYDALGRKTTQRDGSVTGTVRATWSYDTAPKGKGLLAGTTRVTGGSTYATAVTGYDHHGRALGASVTLPASTGALAGTYTSSVTYTADGKVSTQALPKVGGLNAETTTTVYDAAGQPSQLTGSYPNGVYALSARWTPYGESRTVDLGANYSVQPSWTYEAGTRRLLNYWVIRDGQSGHEQDVTYTYDQAGNVTSALDVPTNPGVTGDRQCYRYDGLRRLIEAWTPTSTACSTTPTVAGLGGAAKYWNTYSYDAVGNRTKVTNHNTTDTVATYVYPAAGAARAHAVTSVAAVTGATTKTSTYTYDAAGNMMGRTVAGAAKQTLVWDVEGELVSVAQDGNGDGDTADAAETDTYVYSADGDRLLRVQDGKTTAYLPGGTEATLSGATVTALRYYIFGGHTVAVRTANAASGTTTLLADPHGTRTAQVNQNGNVIIRNYTDPFGGRRNATVLTGDHGFLDKPVDTTGLTQVGARYYDPALGRFVTVDPLLDLSDPQQWNPYAYANSNPVTWSDPTGLILDDDGNPRNAPHPAAIARAKAGPTVSSRTSIAPRRQWSEAAIKADNQMHPANKLMPRWMPTQGKVAAAVIEPADFVANTIDATRRPTFSMYWGSIQQWIDGANAAVLNTALTFSPFFELRGATVAARATAGSAAAARTATNTADDALAAATRAAPSSVSVGPGASLENITVSQATRIQNAANRIGQPISLVGSRASGTSGAYSDWDYVITGINSRVKHSVSGSLPRGATELGYGRQIDIFTGPLGDHLPHITFNPVG